jgi:Ca2+-binding EF-hand superfamily protein
VRHLTRCFDQNPGLRPSATPLGDALDTAAYTQTELSEAQAAQIKEIFELFDTDGGGYIDQRELKFAMTSLGFQTKDNLRLGTQQHKEALELMENLMGDGKVTLEEFSALVTGDTGGIAPYEQARTTFTILSKSDGNSKYDGLITLGKLEKVCLEFKVQLPIRSNFLALKI